MIITSIIIGRYSYEIEFKTFNEFLAFSRYYRKTFNSSIKGVITNTFEEN